MPEGGDYEMLEAARELVQGTEDSERREYLSDELWASAKRHWVAEMGREYSEEEAAELVMDVMFFIKQAESEVG